MGILIFEMLCGFTPFWDSGSPVKIYENILRGRVKYPPYLHPDAVDLLSQLITADLTKRLGNLHGGSEDVKNHPWFAEVTWDRLARKDIDAPYVPPVRGGQGDASQYDKYPEETESYGARGEDTYVSVFPLFHWSIANSFLAVTVIYSLVSRARWMTYDETIIPFLEGVTLLGSGPSLQNFGQNSCCKFLQGRALVAMYKFAVHSTFLSLYDAS